MMREFPSVIARCCTDIEDREEVSGLTNPGCSYLLEKLANYVNLTSKLKAKRPAYKHVSRIQKFSLDSVFYYSKLVCK